MQATFLILLFIVGSVVGSFLCCQARRLHSKKKLGPRSVCLSCKYQLKWYDNIPIISWLVLRGKCRKCHKKIGVAEFLSEISTGLAFLGFGTTINVASVSSLEWFIFIATIALALFLGFLAIYDGLYGELPMLFLILSIISATIVMILKICFTLSVTNTNFSPDIILNPLGSTLLLGGLYFVLYAISKGKWVGDGDWLLGTALGLALSSPWLALITLFVSNTLACVVMAPTIKKVKDKHVHFGPFMIIGFAIATIFANFFTILL